MTYFVFNNYLQSIDSFHVREIFREFLPTVANGNATWVNEVLGQINWEEWIYLIGSDPTGTLNFTTANNSEAIDLAMAYIANQGNSNPPNYLDYLYWPSPSQVVFHDTLLNLVPSGEMTLKIWNQVDANYNLTCCCTNNEVLQRWLPMGILVNSFICADTPRPPITTRSQSFVSSTGRIKYLAPVYQAMTDIGFGEYGFGAEWLNENANFYSS